VEFGLCALTVIPAQAGIHLLVSEMGEIWRWTPAFSRGLKFILSACEAVEGRE
jgi:hypothetical protein